MIGDVEDRHAGLLHFDERVFETFLEVETVCHDDSRGRHHLHVLCRRLEVVRIGSVRNDDFDARGISDDRRDDALERAVRDDDRRYVPRRRRGGGRALVRHRSCLFHHGSRFGGVGRGAARRPTGDAEHPETHERDDRANTTNGDVLLGDHMWSVH